MSEWNVVVVQLEAVNKHPNADALEITQVHGGYPCIFKSGSFKEGDLAVYVPIDSIVPLNDPRFSFLSENGLKKTARIKAKKLRGVFSMGLLVPADSDMQLNEDVHERMRITKWDPEEAIKTSGETEKDPGFMPVYTDIESWRKHKDVIQPDEIVVLTEKIHGTNARYCYRDGRLWVGSHRTIKKDGDNFWWKVAKSINLEEKLSQFPNFVFYGEIYGNVQFLKYGANNNQLFFRVFDIFNTTNGHYLDWVAVEAICENLGLQTVPVLYKGSWTEELIELRNGRTTLGADHIREGFVVHPILERWDHKCGRVILKFVGEEYLLLKG